MFVDGRRKKPIKRPAEKGEKHMYNIYVMTK